jgi:hypothetical protein
MTSLSRPRTIAIAAVGVATIAATAGCTPHFGAASSPSALSTRHSTSSSGPDTGVSTSTTPAGTSTTPASKTDSPSPDPVTVAPTTDSPSPDPVTVAPTTSSPSMDPTTVAPTTSSPSPSSASASPTATCTTSAAKGSCSYTYPQIQGNPSQVTVGQDVWSPVSGWQQTLHATDPGNWYVTANMPARNTAVVSFPNTGANYNSPLISSFPVIYSSFSENMGTASATDAHAGYDLWFNNWKNEVMIQHDFTASGPRCDSYEASATFGGSNGVPVQKWSLCQFGSELIWQLAANEQSGSVDIKAMTTWLENNGYMPQNSTITALSYGFEICSTGGQNQNFSVSSFSITTS